MYRPGKSGGDSENTPDTKPAAWASAGRRVALAASLITKTQPREKEDSQRQINQIHQ